MGNNIIQTPHLDQLARNGILFQNAYLTTSICAVSRASVLSGQSPLVHAELRQAVLNTGTAFLIFSEQKKTFQERGGIFVLRLLKCTRRV